MNTKPFNFDANGAIFYVTVATVISSHVTFEDIMFSRESSFGISLLSI